jgi:hypothetical protein
MVKKEPDFRMRLEVEGLGIIFYSPFAVEGLREGEDYFSRFYFEPEDVVRHVMAGTIVGFATGSPGTYFLLFYEGGYPTDEFLSEYEFILRLGIEVRDSTICIRDLYDLMEWHASCPRGQSFSLEDGFYHITLCSKVPDSGIIGDRQVIFVFLKHLDFMPALKYGGVPTLGE